MDGSSWAYCVGVFEVVQDAVSIVQHQPQLPLLVLLRLRLVLSLRRTTAIPAEGPKTGTIPTISKSLKPS
jgi:hypothetical protein